MEAVERDWTPEEDSALQVALVYFPCTMDPKVRWKGVAEKLGTGRTPEQCRKRFEVAPSLPARMLTRQDVKRAALEEQGRLYEAMGGRDTYEPKRQETSSEEEEDEEEEGSSESDHSDSGEEAEDSGEGEAAAVEGKRRPALPKDLLDGGLGFGASATQVHLDGVMMDGIAVCTLLSVCLSISCNRCQWQHDVKLGIPRVKDEVGTAVEIAQVGERESAWSKFCPQCVVGSTPPSRPQVQA